MEDVRDQGHDPSLNAPESNSLPPAPSASMPPPGDQYDFEEARRPSPEVDDSAGLFSDFPMAPEREPGLDRVLEIPLAIHVELGRKRVKIRELMQVGAGTVLTLDLQAGAPLSIYANQTLIAEGEAVVVGERYGVRVTDIVSPAERVRRLGGDD